jgi:hypothetical protein
MESKVVSSPALVTERLKLNHEKHRTRNTEILGFLLKNTWMGA